MQHQAAAQQVVAAAGEEHAVGEDANAAAEADEGNQGATALFLKVTQLI
jgi:hypothetical protein